MKQLWAIIEGPDFNAIRDKRVEITKQILMKLGYLTN